MSLNHLFIIIILLEVNHYFIFLSLVVNFNFIYFIGSKLLFLL